MFLVTQEGLFCHQREPLFGKSGKNDIFCSKKFAMSLFRAIFAFGNGREMANLVLVFPECLRSAFALGSLCLRFRKREQRGKKRKGRGKEEELRIEI